ncbi:hypothetical protein Aduo_008911 [Ancylostoma duodenale]
MKLKRLLPADVNDSQLTRPQRSMDPGRWREDCGDLRAWPSASPAPSPVAARIRNSVDFDSATCCYMVLRNRIALTNAAFAARRLVTDPPPHAVRKHRWRLPFEEWLPRLLGKLRSLLRPLATALFANAPIVV